MSSKKISNYSKYNQKNEQPREKSNYSSHKNICFKLTSILIFNMITFKSASFPPMEASNGQLAKAVLK